MVFEESQENLTEDVSDFLVNKSAKDRMPKNLEDLGL